MEERLFFRLSENASMRIYRKIIADEIMEYGAAAYKAMRRAIINFL
jgi:hypothetical protein